MKKVWLATPSGVSEGWGEHVGDGCFSARVGSLWIEYGPNEWSRTEMAAKRKSNALRKAEIKRLAVVIESTTERVKQLRAIDNNGKGVRDV